MALYEIFCIENLSCAIQHISSTFSFEGCRTIESVHNLVHCLDYTGVFNDIAVAAHVALDAYPDRCNIDRPILVIDLDVHQACKSSKKIFFMVYS